MFEVLCHLVNLPLRYGGLSVLGGEECRHEWVGSGEVNQDGFTCEKELAVGHK